MIIGVFIVASIAAIMTIVYLVLLLIDTYSYKINISYKSLRFLETIIIFCIITLVVLGVVWYAKKFW